MAKNLICLTEQQYMTEYLRRAADLEYDRYSMEKMTEKLKNAYSANKDFIDRKEGEIARLGRECGDMQKRVMLNPHSMKAGDVISGALRWAGIIFGIMLVENIVKFGILTPLMELCGTVGVAIFVFYVAAPLVISYLRCKAKTDEKNTAEHAARQRDLTGLRSETAAANEAVRRARMRAAYLEKEMGRCTLQYYRLNMARKDFYGNGLIPEKYRDAVPMATMYDYFATRICSKLEGYEGAFARFEYQIRLDRIASTVDQISRKMDAVIRNQGQILRKVEDIDRHIDSVVAKIEENGSRMGDIQKGMQNMQGSLDRVAENAELTKYYSEVTARCAQYKMWKDGYTYNRYL